MPLPNFIIIGAPKSGTTSLAYHLARHPQVCFSSKKEPCFFTRHYDKGLSWYQRYWDHWNGEPAIGEGSVHYSLNAWYPQAPARIAEHLPDVRLIYMTRHPLERVESMWHQHLSTGIPIPPFNQAVREWRPLLEGSLFDYQYRQYLRHFPAERILHLFFEDYIADPVASLRRACEHLGIDADAGPDEAGENRNPRDNLLVDRGLWKRVRNTPLGRACRAHVPEPVKAVMRLAFRKPIDVTARWEPSTLRWAADQVREDAARWLARHGRDADFWDLSERYIARKLAPAPPPRGVRGGDSSEGAAQPGSRMLEVN